MQTFQRKITEKDLFDVLDEIRNNVIEIRDMLKKNKARSSVILKNDDEIEDPDIRAYVHRSREKGY